MCPSWAPAPCAGARSTGFGRRTGSCSAGWRTSCTSRTRRRSTSSTTTPWTARSGSRSCSSVRPRTDVSDNGSRPTREQALATLRDNDKFLLTTHERPDGDAIGSLAAMQHVLTALGKDAVAFLTADEFPLPYEYRFIRLDGLVTEPPADLGERIMVFLDCGNVDRTPAAALRNDGRSILNIDHHHDNTRFG